MNAKSDASRPKAAHEVHPSEEEHSSSAMPPEERERLRAREIQFDVFAARLVSGRARRGRSRRRRRRHDLRQRDAAPVVTYVEHDRDGNAVPITVRASLPLPDPTWQQARAALLGHEPSGADAARTFIADKGSAIAELTKQGDVRAAWRTFLHSLHHPDLTPAQREAYKRWVAEAFATPEGIEVLQQLVTPGPERRRRQAEAVRETIHLSVREAAAATGLSKSTVQRLRNAMGTEVSQGRGRLLKKQ